MDLGLGPAFHTSVLCLAGTAARHGPFPTSQWRLSSRHFLWTQKRMTLEDERALSVDLRQRPSAPPVPGVQAVGASCGKVWLKEPPSFQSVVKAIIFPSHRMWSTQSGDTDLLMTCAHVVAFKRSFPCVGSPCGCVTRPQGPDVLSPKTGPISCSLFFIRRIHILYFVHSEGATIISS